MSERACAYKKVKIVKLSFLFDLYQNEFIRTRQFPCRGLVLLSCGPLTEEETASFPLWRCFCFTQTAEPARLASGLRFCPSAGSSLSFTRPPRPVTQLGSAPGWQVSELDVSGGMTGPKRLHILTSSFQTHLWNVSLLTVFFEGLCIQGQNGFTFKDSAENLKTQYTASATRVFSVSTTTKDLKQCGIMGVGVVMSNGHLKWLGQKRSQQSHALKFHSFYVTFIDFLPHSLTYLMFPCKLEQQVTESNAPLP